MGLAGIPLGSHDSIWVFGDVHEIETKRNMNSTSNQIIVQMALDTLCIFRVPFLKSGWNKQKPSRTSRFNNIMHHVCKFQAMLKLRFRITSQLVSPWEGCASCRKMPLPDTWPSSNVTESNVTAFPLKIQVTAINIKLGISSIKKSHILTYYTLRGKWWNHSQPQKKRRCRLNVSVHFF